MSLYFVMSCLFIIRGNLCPPNRCPSLSLWSVFMASIQMLFISSFFNIDVSQSLSGILLVLFTDFQQARLHTL